MDSYTAELSAFDHMHELIALRSELVVAKARRSCSRLVEPSDAESAHISKIRDTIGREMADLAIILDNYVVGPLTRAEREKLFLKHGNEIEVEVITKPVESK